jgi:hypothetical protein
VWEITEYISLRSVVCGGVDLYPPKRDTGKEKDHNKFQSLKQGYSWDRG